MTQPRKNKPNEQLFDETGFLLTQERPTRIQE